MTLSTLFFVSNSPFTLRAQPSSKSGFPFSHSRTSFQKQFTTSQKQKQKSRQQPAPFSPWSCQQSDEQSSSDSEFEEFVTQVRQYLTSGFAADEGPLAFENLKRAGRTDIMAGIIKFGGYATMASRMGVDVKLFIPPLEAAASKSFPNFFRPEPGASIKFGEKLEARLESIDSLKHDTPTNEGKGEGMTVRRRRSSVGDQVPSAEELIRQNEKFLPPIVDEIVPEGETLSLPTSMRVGALLLAALVAVGYGKASQELLPMESEMGLRALANALMAVHVGLGAYVGGIVAPKLNRDPALWLVKVVICGPLGVRLLRSLGPL